MGAEMGSDGSALIDDPNFWRKQERELASQELWQRLARAQSLPTLSSAEDVRLGRDSPEVWVVGKSLLGSGVTAITIRIEHRGAFHDGKTVKGKVHMCRGAPTSEFVISAIASAMTDPLTTEETGPPHRPLRLRVAKELSSCFGAMGAAMDPLDVSCELASESETQALATATAAALDCRQGGWGYRHALLALLVLLLAALVLRKF